MGAWLHVAVETLCALAVRTPCMFMTSWVITDTNDATLGDFCRSHHGNLGFMYASLPNVLGVYLTWISDPLIAHLLDDISLLLGITFYANRAQEL